MIEGVGVGLHVALGADIVAEEPFLGLARPVGAFAGRQVLILSRHRIPFGTVQLYTPAGLWDGHGSRVML